MVKASAVQKEGCRFESLPDTLLCSSSRQWTAAIQNLLKNRLLLHGADLRIASSSRVDFRHSGCDHDYHKSITIIISHKVNHIDEKKKKLLISAGLQCWCIHFAVLRSESLLKSITLAILVKRSRMTCCSAPWDNRKSQYVHFHERQKVGPMTLRCCRQLRVFNLDWIFFDGYSKIRQSLRSFAAMRKRLLCLTTLSVCVLSSALILFPFSFNVFFVFFKI